MDFRLGGTLFAPFSCKIPTRSLTPFERIAMAGSNGYSRHDKRKYPRFCMDWPLDYRMTDGPQAYGGLVMDGSEVGLRIHSIKNLPIGTRLKIAVMFPKGFQMTNFDVLAEIVWKDLYYEEERKTDINMD